MNPSTNHDDLAHLTVAHIEVAAQSARQVSQQQLNANWKVIRYVVEALDRGTPLASVIAATGFVPDQPRESSPWHTYYPVSTEEAFGMWMATLLRTGIKSREEAA